MRKQSMQFFERLVDAAGPSGDERLPARVWREYAAAFADTRHDTLGSSFAEAVPNGDPQVAIFGHIDEIGLVINHVDDEGYLWFGPLGGWDPEVLVGQRVRILGKDGPLAGVVGKKSRHHQDAADREKPSKLRDLWIDVGAARRRQPLRRLRRRRGRSPVRREAGLRLADRRGHGRRGDQLPGRIHIRLRVGSRRRDRG
jgi:endoglucanase